MLSLHTHVTQINRFEFWRYMISRYALRKKRGPDSVRDSLVRGLQELGMEFTLDSKQPGDIAVVLSGVEALRQAIIAKRSGYIQKLVSGPNVVTHPFEASEIMLDEAIDTILVPSQWVADFWTQEAPELTNKVKVWPSGVAKFNASTRTGKPVIYDKLGDPALVAYIQQLLRIPARAFKYGSFKQRDYLAALADAPFLIYLSESESQGLALQEAWAHDVPTLVNKSTRWQSGEFVWEAPQINCPYLSPELGAVFETFEEIPTMIAWISKLHPKPYCDEHLSDRASANKLLQLL